MQIMAIPTKAFIATKANNLYPRSKAIIIRTMTVTLLITSNNFNAINRSYAINTPSNGRNGNEIKLNPPAMI